LKQKHEPQLFPTDFFSNPIVLDWSFLEPNSSPLMFPRTQFFPTDFSSNPILPDWSYLQPNSSQLIFPPQPNSSQLIRTPYSVQVFFFPTHTEVESKNTGEKNNWKKHLSNLQHQPASQPATVLLLLLLYLPATQNNITSSLFSQPWFQSVHKNNNNNNNNNRDCLISVIISLVYLCCCYV
jgi:hypothetical protein